MRLLHLSTLHVEFNLSISYCSMLLIYFAMFCSVSVCIANAVYKFGRSEAKASVPGVSDKLGE